MVLPSLTSTILLTSMQRPSQISRPVPTTVPDSRPSRLKIRGSESTSTLTTLKSTKSLSDCELSSVPSWRPNPVPLDLTGSTTTYWNTSLRTHQRSSRRSWTSFGSLVISLLGGGQQQWSQSQDQTRTTLTHSVTDQSRWPVVYASSWNAWLSHALSGILKNMAYWTKANVGSGSTIAPRTT